MFWQAELRNCATPGLRHTVVPPTATGTSQRETRGSAVEEHRSVRPFGRPHFRARCLTSFAIEPDTVGRALIDSYALILHVTRVAHAPRCWNMNTNAARATHLDRSRRNRRRFCNGTRKEKKKFPPRRGGGSPPRHTTISGNLYGTSRMHLRGLCTPFRRLRRAHV